jgi:NADH:ubiquinone oxidoreductase subunit H
MGRMQRREGPMIEGRYGLIQPILDGLKLFLKESIFPIQSNNILYLLSPILSIFLSLLIFGILPIYNGMTTTKSSVLYILIILSINIYSILYGGWSSNSKYSKIGSMRSISQLLSYEISISILIMTILYINKSHYIEDIIYKQIYISNIFIIWPILFLLIITLIAESNRPPFDLPEAESELIAGYLVEYGGFKFAAIYLAEYLYVYFFSVFLSILFIGINTYTSISVYIIIYIIIWIRATEPRIKYKELIKLGWINILPLSLYLYLFFLFLY